jgi:hypothetical protein
MMFLLSAETTVLLPDSAKPAPIQIIIILLTGPASTKWFLVDPANGKATTFAKMFHQAAETSTPTQESAITASAIRSN